MFFFDRKGKKAKKAAKAAFKEAFAPLVKRKLHKAALRAKVDYVFKVVFKLKVEKSAILGSPRSCNEDDVPHFSLYSFRDTQVQPCPFNLVNNCIRDGNLLQVKFVEKK